MIKRKGPTFYQIGLLALSEKVFQLNGIRHKLSSRLLEVVADTREKNPPDASMKHVLALLLAISKTPDSQDTYPSTKRFASQKDFYAEYFEDALLVQARSVYCPLIPTWESLSTCAYLEAAAREVEAESEHTKMYLPETSQVRLRLEMQNSLMNAPEVGGLRGLLQRENGGVLTLVNQISTDHPEASPEILATLRTIFKISLCRTDACEIFCDVLAQQMKKDASVITAAEEFKNTVKASYVESLLKLKRKYELIVHEGMRDYKPLKDHMDGVFPSIIRALPTDEIATQLAIHYNLLLKKNGTKDEHLQEAICVLQYLTDKDIFENVHRKHLKRRLLMSEATEDQRELEGTLMNLIKPHYDTTTMELMFRDYKMATTERNTWISFIEGQAMPLEFRPLVLNTNRWNQESLGLALPPLLQGVIDTYTAWYSSVHTSRKLNWIGLGTATVSYKAAGRTYRLMLEATPQLVFLLQFAEADNLTIEDISNSTGASASTVMRFIAPFAAAKIGVLVKNKGTESYSVNAKFKSSTPVVKIPMGARAVAADDKSKTSSEISDSRRAQTQAAIVRMMKQSKALQHADLMARVMEELTKRFKPDPKAIKHEIAWLIQEGYLKRSEADNNIYEYQA